MWRHGDADADAVTDAVVDGDADTDARGDAVAAIVPERETVEHAEPDRDCVTVTDADAHAVARDELLAAAVEDGDRVGHDADGQAVADRDLVTDVVKEPVAVMDRVPGSDGGRDGDCDGVPNCVVVRVPVFAPEVLGETVWLLVPVLLGDDVRQADVVPVREGDGEADLDGKVERESDGVGTSVGGRVCVLEREGALVDEPLRDDVRVAVGEGERDSVADPVGHAVGVLVPAGDTDSVGVRDVEGVARGEPESVVTLEGARVTRGVAVVRLTDGDCVAEPEWVRETVAVQLRDTVRAAVAEPHADTEDDAESEMLRVSVGVAERE